MFETVLPWPPSWGKSPWGNRASEIEIKLVFWHTCCRFLQGVRLSCALVLWCLTVMDAATTLETMQCSLVPQPSTLLPKQTLRLSARPLNRAWWTCMMCWLRRGSKLSYKLVKLLISSFFVCTCSNIIKLEIHFIIAYIRIVWRCTSCNRFNTEINKKVKLSSWLGIMFLVYMPVVAKCGCDYYWSSNIQQLKE